MREIELAGAAGDHLYFRDGLVHLLLPVHKTATQGKLTERSLGCGCTVKQQPLCPFHAATRHLQRLEILQGSLDLQSVPLFPSDYGKVLEKSQVISLIRQTLRAAGATATRQDEVGNLIERFGGHVLLVAGAQHLYLLGLRWDLVQLHGRWSSVAVQRYLQEAPLLQVPGHLFAPRSPDWSRTGSKEPSWHQMHDRRPWHLAPLPWEGGERSQAAQNLGALRVQFRSVTEGVADVVGSLRVWRLCGPRVVASCMGMPGGLEQIAQSETVFSIHH